MQEAPDIGKTNGNEEPNKSSSIKRVNWKKDNIIKDATCVTAWILLNDKEVSEENFGKKFVELFNKATIAQWDKKISLKDHVQETQGMKILLRDLLARTKRALTKNRSSEDPRTNEIWKNNWERLVHFIETGEYLPAPPAALVLRRGRKENEDIVPEDFEW